MSFIFGRGRSSVKRESQPPPPVVEDFDENQHENQQAIGAAEEDPSNNANANEIHLNDLTVAAGVQPHNMTDRSGTSYYDELDYSATSLSITVDSKFYSDNDDSSRDLSGGRGGSRGHHHHHSFPAGMPASDGGGIHPYAAKGRRNPDHHLLMLQKELQGLSIGDIITTIPGSDVDYTSVTENEDAASASQSQNQNQSQVSKNDSGKSKNKNDDKKDNNQQSFLWMPLRKQVEQAQAAQQAQAMKAQSHQEEGASQQQQQQQQQEETQQKQPASIQKDEQQNEQQKPFSQVENLASVIAAHAQSQDLMTDLSDRAKGILLNELSERGLDMSELSDKEFMGELSERGGGHNGMIVLSDKTQREFPQMASLVQEIESEIDKIFVDDKTSLSISSGGHVRVNPGANNTDEAMSTSAGAGVGATRRRRHFVLQLNADGIVNANEATPTENKSAAAGAVTMSPISPAFPSSINTDQQGPINIDPLISSLPPPRTGSSSIRNAMTPRKSNLRSTNSNDAAINHDPLLGGLSRSSSKPTNTKRESRRIQIQTLSKAELDDLHAAQAASHAANANCGSEKSLSCDDETGKVTIRGTKIEEVTQLLEIALQNDPDLDWIEIRNLYLPASSPTPSSLEVSINEHNNNDHQNEADDDHAALAEMFFDDLSDLKILNVLDLQIGDGDNFTTTTSTNSPNNSHPSHDEIPMFLQAIAEMPVLEEFELRMRHLHTLPEKFFSQLLLNCIDVNYSRKEDGTSNVVQYSMDVSTNRRILQKPVLSLLTLSFLTPSFLQCLSLWNVRFTASQVKLLCETLENNMSKVKRLELWSNEVEQSTVDDNNNVNDNDDNYINNQDDQGRSMECHLIMSLARMLHKNTSLEAMILSHVTLYQSGCQAFNDALQVNNTLEVLALYDVLDEDTAMVSEAVATMMNDSRIYVKDAGSIQHSKAKKPAALKSISITYSPEPKKRESKYEHQEAVRQNLLLQKDQSQHLLSYSMSDVHAASSSIMGNNSLRGGSLRGGSMRASQRGGTGRSLRNFSLRNSLRGGSIRARNARGKHVRRRGHNKGILNKYKSEEKTVPEEDGEDSEKKQEDGGGCIIS